MDLEEVGVWALVIGVIVFIVCALALIAFGIGYWTESNQIEIFVDNEKVYSGAKYWVLIESGGDTTTITIKGGLLGMFTERVYTSKAVVVKPLN